MSLRIMNKKLLVWVNPTLTASSMLVVSIFHATTISFRRIVIAILFLAVSSFLSEGAFGQAVGDYRTQADGNWATLGTWQRLNVLPNTWATPTAGQGLSLIHI